PRPDARDGRAQVPCQTRGADRGGAEAARWQDDPGFFGPHGPSKRSDKDDLMFSKNSSYAVGTLCKSHDRKQAVFRDFSIITGSETALVPAPKGPQQISPGQPWEPSDPDR